MGKAARFTYEDIKKFPKDIQEAIYRQIAGPAAHMEPRPGAFFKIADALKITGKGCNIHIHSIRKRYTDPDGVCAKWAIDALVLAGLLPDDRQEIVREVRYSQERGEKEETIITVEY